MSQLLYRFHGIVVQGFGRGSKQLGIPTANLPESVVDQLPERFPTGIYLGWANIGGGDVHKMVMSVGWNPFYNNTKKSMEVHIIHKFNEDFYGQDLRAVVLEYIRAERGFNSVDELITAIRSDISIATERLEEEQLTIYKHDSFLKQQTTNSYQGSNLPLES